MINGINLHAPTMMLWQMQTQYMHTMMNALATMAAYQGMLAQPVPVPAPQMPPQNAGWASLQHMPMGAVKVPHRPMLGVPHHHASNTLNILLNHIIYSGAQQALAQNPNRKVVFDGKHWHAQNVMSRNYNWENNPKHCMYRNQPVSVENNPLKERATNTSPHDTWVNLPQNAYFKTIPSLHKEHEYRKPHFLVLPKKPYKDFADFLSKSSEDEKTALQTVLRAMPAGATVYSNSGGAREIPWFHVHVKPHPQNDDDRAHIQTLLTPPLTHNKQTQRQEKLQDNMRDVGNNHATLAQNHYHKEIAIFDVDDTLIDEKTGKLMMPVVQEFESLLQRGVRPIICSNGQSTRIVPLMERFLANYNCAIADHFYPDTQSVKSPKATLRFVHEQAKTIDKTPITLISAQGSETVKPKYAAQVAKIFPRANNITVYGDNLRTDGALADALNTHYPHAQVSFRHVIPR